jgi:[ribosomal protein S18]-alanine N-acetyltransferase
MTGPTGTPDTPDILGVTGATDTAGVLLRPMRWWDVSAVLPAERDLFGPTAWSAELFWSELAHPAARSYLIAEDGAGRLLGYAGLHRGGPEADVQTIAVLPGAQGRGVGGVLLRALIDRAVRAGAGSLLLEVRADNAPAIALYTRHGFRRISVRRGYYQPGGQDAWVMRLRPLPRPDPPRTTLPG